MRSLKASNPPDQGSSVIRQSGVVPYRIQAGTVEVLLITTKKRRSGKNTNRWSIPKGSIEPYLSAADSAAKEAYEEAGILGRVKTPAIGHYNRRKLGLPCQVEVFLMQVEDVLADWQEAKSRKRCWLTLSQAIAAVHDEQLKQILTQLASQNLFS